MSLKEEKWEVAKELINTITECLDDEGKLTGEMLRELKGKISEMIENDF